MHNISEKYNIILASKSPRRQQLLHDLGIEFTVQTIDVDEVFPNDMPWSEVAEYLAKLKASAFTSQLSDRDLLITSDTVVCIEGEILGKPKDRDDAIAMLNKLSATQHEVITGVCLTTKMVEHAFSSRTNVYFKKLSSEEIEHYVDTFKPFDKAGSYGIQEWIGYIGIEKIEGSYFNVMGLPVHELYQLLQNNFS